MVPARPDQPAGLVPSRALQDSHRVVYGQVQLAEAEEQVVFVSHLFVNPDVRRGGVATALLERAVAYALEIGAVGMFLETAMDNATAQAVYERAGWTREGRFYKYNAVL